MSILDPQEHYDIIFGGGSPEDTGSFLQDYKPATGVDLTIGDVVEVVSEGGEPRVSKLTYSAFSTAAAGGDAAHINAAALATYDAIMGKKRALVVWEGNSELEGGYLANTVTTVFGSYVMETTNYAAGVYAPGTKVSVSAGAIKAKATGEPTFGEVVAYDATAAILTIAVPGL